MSIKLKSNAKINLGLKINHKRDDGYHNITTLMQEIDLCDEITLSKNNSNKISIHSQGIQCPEDETNSCYLSAKLFFNEFNIVFAILASSVDTTHLSINFDFIAALIVQLIRGLPFIITIFFFLIPLLPPRAGINANTFFPLIKKF